MVLVASLAAVILLFGINLLQFSGPTTYVEVPRPERTEPVPVAPTPPAPVATESASVDDKPGLWAKLTGAVKNSANTSEQEKEIAGLREDIARLNEKLENRKDIDPNALGMIQFTGPNSIQASPSDTLIKIENIKISRDEPKSEFIVDFELHNVDPKQRQAKGYIVVLAKSANALTAYPQNLFNPNQNILLNFTKGETFAVSRFRQARANIPMGLNAKIKTDFQILLFGTDGKVINSVHVEESK